MERIQKLEQEVNDIKERNIRVEADKAWETSLSRKILIVILTCLTIVLFFHFADLPDPFINAIVPAIGFILSTLSIPIFKKVWIKHYNKR